MRRRPVLMYHAIGTGPDPLSIQVSAKQLHRQLSTLQRFGFRGVSIRELLTDGNHRDRLVGLTFDDGYADFATDAAPVLKQFAFTATVFMVAGQIGEYNAWDPPPQRSLMTVEQLREMHDAGHEIGSHGLRHVPVDQLSASELRAELADSRGLLESIVNAPVGGFCYPYGALGPAAVAAVQRHYDYACAVAPADPGRWTLPRFFVGEADSPLRLAAKLALRPVRERLRRRRS